MQEAWTKTTTASGFILTRFADERIEATRCSTSDPDAWELYQAGEKFLLTRGSSELLIVTPFLLSWDLWFVTQTYWIPSSETSSDVVETAASDTASEYFDGEEAAGYSPAEEEATAV